MDNESPGATAAVVRAYQGRVVFDSPASVRAIREHTRGTHAAMNGMLSRLLALTAADVDGAWVDEWRAAKGPEAVRLACLIALSWFAPVRDAGGPVLSVDEVIERAAGWAAELGHPGEDDAQRFRLCLDPLRIGGDGETGWVALGRPADPTVPQAGWAEARERVTGTPGGPATGDLAIIASHVWGYWSGSGPKTDPATVVERADMLLRALADPRVTVVADVAEQVTGDRDPQMAVAILSEDVRGRRPSGLALLARLDPGLGLDEQWRPGRTVRAELCERFDKWRRSYTQRAEWNAAVAAARDAGSPCGFDWLADGLREGMPGADAVPRIWVELLTHSLTVAVGHRSRVFATVAQWAAAWETVRRAETECDRDRLALVDEWIESQDWFRPGAPIVPGRGAVAAGDVFAAWRLDPESDVDTLVRAAGDLGAGWEQWWRFCAEHPGLWRDETTWPGIDAVHRARVAAARYRPPRLTRPNPDTSPRPTWFRHDLGWPGDLDPSGAVQVTVWDGSGYTPITGRWMSARLRKVTRGQPNDPRARQVSRNDPMSRLAAGVGRSELVRPTGELARAAFTLRAEAGGGRLAVVLRHTPARPGRGPLPDNRRIMGVHLGFGADATWAVWQTVPGDASPEPGAVLVPVGPDRAPIRFATPVSRGRVRLGGPDRWADQSQTDAAGLIAHDLADVIGAPARAVSRHLTGGKTRRSDLARVVLELCRWAQQANNLLARMIVDCARDGSAIAAHPGWVRIEAAWPVRSDTDLVALWDDRDALVGRAVRLTRTRLVHGRHDMGVALDRLSELDLLTRLLVMRETRTRPTDTGADPGTASGPRWKPSGYAGREVAKRARVRASRGDQVAAGIVKAALRENVDVIVFPERPVPGPSAGNRPALNRRIATMSRADVADRVAQMADLHGLRVLTCTPPAVGSDPVSGLALMPVLATNASTVLTHRDSSTWRKQVARARAAAGVDPGDLRAGQVLAAAAWLDGLAAWYATVPAGSRREWHERHRQVPVQIPHPAGQIMVAVDVDPISADPAAGDGGQPGSWRRVYPARWDREQVIADTITRAGVRRTIRQT